MTQTISQFDRSLYIGEAVSVRDVSLVTMAWHHASGGAIRSQAWQHFDNSAGINGELLVRQMNHWRVQYSDQSWLVYQGK